MRRRWVAAALCVLMVMGVAAASSGASPDPPVPPLPDAAERLALNDWWARQQPGQTLCIASRSYATSDRPYVPLRPGGVTAEVGQAVPVQWLFYQVVTIRLAGPSAPGRSWVMADVRVVHPDSPGDSSFWMYVSDFLFVTAEGTVHQPTPGERRGDFTAYAMPSPGVRSRSAGRRSTPTTCAVHPSAPARFRTRAGLCPPTCGQAEGTGAPAVPEQRVRSGSGDPAGAEHRWHHEDHGQ